MRPTRLLLILTAAVLALFAAGCGGQATPVAPAKPSPTLHPTFTPTPLLPTATPVPPTPTPEPPTPTPEPPTATPEQPTPTPEPAHVEVVAPTVNLRAGPATGFALAGRAFQEQTLPILGRNEAGDWFRVQSADGGEAWVTNDPTLVRIVGDVAGVQVAENIPVLPTPRPQPTARPRPVQPTQPSAPAPTQAPAYQFAKLSLDPRVNTNPIVTLFGGLYDRTLNLKSPISGYKMVAVSPSGERKEADFGPVFLRGNPGLGDEFLYNAKIEFPATGGTYRAWVADPGGNQVAEAWDLAVTGDMRTFLPRWKQP